VLYRRLNAELFTSVDLTNVYGGSPLFIIGGNPIIAELPLVELERSRLLTLALNNVLYTYPNPTFWLTADKPACYGGHFFARPDIIKIAYMNYRDEVVEATGKTLKEHSMQLFYNAAAGADLDDFFSTTPAFSWWKSVFPLSLQLAWRLGVRRVYLVGCSFLIGQKPYPWAATLTEFETRWSQGTYNDDIRCLKQLQPMFEDHGFQVISCTPNSRANERRPQS